MTELITLDPQTAITQAQDQPPANAALVYLGSLGSDKSRRVMAQGLGKVAELASDGRLDLHTFPWYALRFQHVAAIRAKLAQELAPATVNRILSALRQTLRTAWRLGQMSAEDYHAAADVKNVKGETLPAGRALTPGEISALMTACANDPSPAGARDAALIAVCYIGGLRRAEAAALDAGDYDPASGELRIRAGKGRKARIAWLTNGAAQAMKDWLAVRGDHPGPLFSAINKGGQIGKGRTNAQTVYTMTRKRAAEAGVKDFSPHDLRRTFVSDLLDAGADIATVQKMAGHASVTTTARYDRRPEAAKQKAAGLLHLPYHRRGL